MQQFILKSPNFNVSGELYRMGYAYQYISLAVESWEVDKKCNVRPCVSTADDYVDYAIQYIADNFKHVKIKEVADYLGINRTYFSTIFRRKMCISPQEYLMKLKMNKGRELLIDTDLPIHAISQSIGYENQMTFSKMFKREYGLSPENYRKNYEGNYLDQTSGTESGERHSEIRGVHDICGYLVFCSTQRVNLGD